MSSTIERFFTVFFLSFSLTSRNSVSSTVDDPSLFPGHLEPLGAKHNKSSVKTLFAFPEPRDFFKNFASASRPVLIKTGAKLSPAFDKWTDDYFRSLSEAENFTIDAENGKKENRTKQDYMRKVPFKDFVEMYKKEDIYMVDAVPTFIQ